MAEEFNNLVTAVADEQDADLILYEGEVNFAGYQLVSDICESRSKPNALLFLSTFGGNADAGFRIARALQHTYGGFGAVIAGRCKSAGTLICIGAAKLLMANRSELGPLDVQVQKKDELFDYGSGLDLFEALSNLRQEALDAFRSYLIDLRTGGRLGTKTASEIATKLVTGLFSPVYAQVDPMRLGEMQRAIAIALAYGERLSHKSRNLKRSALTELVSGYPSHGFVIDRKEARQLFNWVESPTGKLAELCDTLLRAEWSRGSEKACVTYLNRKTENGESQGNSHGQDASIETSTKNSGASDTASARKIE